MWAQLSENPHWFWLTLGGLLLAAELLGASGYLLWSGMSAVTIGLLVWVLPLGWEWQWICFSALTIIAALGWWYWLRQHNQTRQKRVLLNQRSHQLIGTRATLSEPLQDGQGRLKIGDGTWRVRADQNLPAGCEVEVIDVEGITLKIRAVSPSSAV